MCYCCTGLLWTVTPKLVWFLFLYAGVGTWITTSAFGKRLMQLHFTTVQREGDLRFDMVRTRENAGNHNAQHISSYALSDKGQLFAACWLVHVLVPACQACCSNKGHTGELMLLPRLHAIRSFPDQHAASPSRAVQIVSLAVVSSLGLCRICPEPSDLQSHYSICILIPCSLK